MACITETSEEIAKRRIDESDEQVSLLKKDKKTLTAILCALTNEILQLEDGNELITRAETNGKIDIRTFISTHKEEDEKRLKKTLKNYSEHEINLLREMFKNGKL